MKFGSNHSGARSQEIVEIFIAGIFEGRFQFEAGFPACAKFIKSLQIGAAPLSQSPFLSTACQFVFQAQTTVVKSGVYHAVQRSQGKSSFFPFAQTKTLFEVQVLAADGRF